MKPSAQWIWQADDPAPRNTTVCFRRRFSLEQARQAVLHISADSRYLLYLDGQRIGYGPSRAYHAHYEYDTYPLELSAGTHVFAVRVQHWGESTLQHIAARAGLLVQLETSETAVLLTSDASWRLQRSVAFEANTPRIACQLAFEEQFDARLEAEDWAGVNFDDSNWAPALELGAWGMAPWGMLEPRSIPFLTDAPVAVVRVEALGIFRRPEALAALHAAPYLQPGDVSANRLPVDALVATVLHLPKPGEVTLKRCSLYGDAPLLWLNGAQLEWRAAACDVAVVVTLPAGAHLLVLDWRGYAHDRDLTITASGVTGAHFQSPRAGRGQTWLIAPHPSSEARSSAQRASSAFALLESAVDWLDVASVDVPACDVYMDVTASVSLQTPLPSADVRPLPLEVSLAPSGCGQHFLLDFGVMLVGWLEFELDAEEGAIVDMLGCEGMQDGRLQITEMMNNTLRYTTRSGRQRFVSTVRRGLRYVVMAVHGSSANLTLHEVNLRLSTYPWDSARAEFRCADVRLNRLYDVSAHTLRLCSEDTFTDCPTFEQTLWTGDACYSSLLYFLAAHGDPRLPARVLRLAAQSLERLPLVNAQVPGDWENLLIPNWSFLWAMGCREYYLHTGDLALVGELFAALEIQAHTIERSRNCDGLFDHQVNVWHLIDWSGVDSPQGSVPAHENCLAVASLRATADLAGALGKLERSRHWNAVADELSAAVNRSFWSEAEGAYLDCRHADGRLSQVLSQATNLVALLSGVAGAQAPQLRRAVVQPPAHWVEVGTPWLLSLVCEQLALSAQSPELLRLMHDRLGQMLDRGATTLWETFAGAYTKSTTWTRSWCHAWSAGPLYLLPRYVLGARPLEPGYSRVEIAPQLGDLEWAAGRVPTPHGEIVLRLSRRGANLELDLSLPTGITAQLQLPKSVTGWMIEGIASAGGLETGVQHLELMGFEVEGGARVRIYQAGLSSAAR